MKRNRSDEIQIESAGRRAVGGAALMQASVTEALTKALFEEWARVGYGALSLEAVAKRAGVGKAALYRRWPSKLAMVTDLLEKLGLENAPSPDTGSLREDIRLVLRSVRRLLRHPLVKRILPDLHAEMLRSPELSEAVRGRLQTGRRERSAAVFQRAIERGEIPADANVELLIDYMGAMVYWRAIVTGGRIDLGYIEELTEFVLAGVGSSSTRSSE
ncbi:TetR/AcrR family transcriptional regulator [bacterium]|nr:MAG: TetR/AcrR family transcriptional regulator [bacterium]